MYRFHTTETFRSTSVCGKSRGALFLPGYGLPGGKCVTFYTLYIKYFIRQFLLIATFLRCKVDFVR